MPPFARESFAAKAALPLGGGATHPSKLALIGLQNGHPTLAGNEPQYVAGTETTRWM